MDRMRWPLNWRRSSTARHALGSAFLVFVLSLGATASTPALEDLTADQQEDQSDSTTKKAKKAKKGQQEGAFKPGKPKVFGYVQIHFKHAEDSNDDGVKDNDNFRVQRVRVGVRGDIYPWLSYKVVVDPRAPEVAGIMRDAYLTFHALPRHEIRVGQQKMHFGYENLESSTRLYTVNRAELSDALSRGINLRDVGIRVLGDFKLNKRFRIEDGFSIGNGAALGTQDDNSQRKNFWGRVGVRYKGETKEGLQAWLGVSAGSGDFFDPNELADTTDDEFFKFTRLGTDLEIDHRWFFLAAEYVKGTDDNLIEPERTKTSGWYVNVAGKTRWQVGPIVRLDTLSDNLFKRWTFGAYYGAPDAPFRVLFNYEQRKIRDGERADDKVYLWTQVRF